MRAGTLLVVALAALAVGVGARSAPLGPSGQIAFASADGIHVVNADGTGDRLLLTGMRAVDPSWSRDGSRIAVWAVGSGFSLEVLAADGIGEPTWFDGLPPIPGGPVSWSPDGKKLVFSASPDRSGTEYRLYVVEADGTGLRQLTAGYQDRNPSWSPDGRWIAFATTSNGYSQIDLIHPDGSGLRPMLLHSPGRTGLSPAWSPDGRHIVFSAGLPHGFGIEITSPETELQQPLTPGPSDRAPAWSPDGRFIAFATGATGNEIDVIRPDGTGRRPLVVTGTFAATPAWRPVAPALRLLSQGVGDVVPQRPFTVFATVTATGSAPVAGVAVRATLNGAARIVALTPAKGTCAERYLGVVGATCALGDLAPGGYAVLRVRIRPSGSGRLVINLSVTSKSNELDRSDNSISLHTRVSR